MKIDNQIRVECDDCRKEAEYALCQECYDKLVEKEYERGIEDGRALVAEEEKVENQPSVELGLKDELKDLQIK